MTRYVAAVLILACPAVAIAQRAASIPATTASAKTKGGLDPDKVRCIKSPVIGTLSQFTKTCMTNREWDRSRTEIQRMRNPTSCGGGASCNGG